jgi:hypothetical protein
MRPPTPSHDQGGDRSQESRPGSRNARAHHPPLGVRLAPSARRAIDPLDRDPKPAEYELRQAGPRASAALDDLQRRPMNLMFAGHEEPQNPLSYRAPPVLRLEAERLARSGRDARRCASMASDRERSVDRSRARARAKAPPGLGAVRVQTSGSSRRRSSDADLRTTLLLSGSGAVISGRRPTAVVASGCGTKEESAGNGVAVPRVVLRDHVAASKSTSLRGWRCVLPVPVGSNGPWKHGGVALRLHVSTRGRVYARASGHF